MCGIVGYISSAQTLADKNIVKRMANSIRHRGPDGEGEWLNEHIALGHRRLAIIDTSQNGLQPFVSNDGRFIITYNGEIYNYTELKEELEQLGYKHKTQTDTEVLLNAFIEWKEKCLSRLNGMFAFVVYDRIKNEVFLARDRYGIKPLYIYNKGGLFAFASEQKALLQHPEIEASLDMEGLVEYLSFQNFLSSKTLIKNIEMLPTGSFAVYKVANRDFKTSKFWSFMFEEPEIRLTQREYQEELSALFSRAVKRQMVADVEVGAYLSGGIDSAAIASVASVMQPNLKSFTCGFDLSSASGIELNFDERRTAESISAILGTEQYEIVLKAGDMERCFGLLVDHIEEPRVGQSYPNYYAAKLASKFVKVVLSGAGGDELFGGYPWRYFVAERPEKFKDNYFDYWNRLIPNKELKSLLNQADGLEYVDYPRDIFNEVLGSPKITNRSSMINASLTFEAKTFLHGLLVVEDKISMSHGLESRVPFLDNDLVDFATKCPADLKVSDPTNSLKINESDPDNKKEKYFTLTNDGKKILRNSLKSVLSDDILSLKKQGFSAPDASWFRGKSIEFVKGKIYKPQSNLFKYINYDQVIKSLEQHFTGKENRRLFIWAILSLTEYFEKNEL